MKTPQLLVALCMSLAASASAQDNVTLSAPINNLTIASGSAIPSVDLQSHFAVTGVQGTVVSVSTSLGSVNVLMFDDSSASNYAPTVVTNFLRYVNEGRYTNTFIHRSAASATPSVKIIQGGGFVAKTGFPAVTPLANCSVTSGSKTVTCNDTSTAVVGMTVTDATGTYVPAGTTITSITNATTFVMSAAALASTPSGQTFNVAYPPIALVTGDPGDVTNNTLGTIAMARTTAPDSATSQWFFNTADNTTNLPSASNNGYAVFGRILGSGMSVVNAIAALPVASSLASPFSQLPYSGTAAPNPNGTNLSNLVLVNGMTSGPVFPTTSSQTSYVRFSVTNSNPNLVQATIKGSTLDFQLTPGRGGTANLEVVATDAAGNTASTPFTITVTGGTSISTFHNNSDLNGDGIDDLVFQYADGQIVSWLMNGAGGISQMVWTYPGIFGDWKVVAHADMNGDGHTDLILQNPGGQVWVMLLDGNGVKAGGMWLFPLGIGEWRVVGVGDINRDGFPDLVVQNRAGSLSAFLTDGNGGITGSVEIFSGNLGGWRAVGVADMNGDGIDDITFQSVGGQIYVWLLDGSGTGVNPVTLAGLKSGSGYLSSASLGDWKVAALADINHDGIPDLVFQNSSGSIVAWLLDGTATAVNLTSKSGLKAGPLYLFSGDLGDWRVR